MTWYSGMRGGKALGDLLFGNANFSGKLPLSWPASYGDLPLFDPGIPNAVKMDYYLGYRYFDKTDTQPLFPFGYGKSYTKFTYRNLEVPCRTVKGSGVVEVKVDVVNTGDREGDEIVFLFVSYPQAVGRRPAKELKGFARVTLKPGEAEQVTLPLRIKDLKHWNMETEKWEIHTGKVRVMVGRSSDALLLSDELEVI